MKSRSLVEKDKVMVLGEGTGCGGTGLSCWDFHTGKRSVSLFDLRYRASHPFGECHHGWSWLMHWV